MENTELITKAVSYIKNAASESDISPEDIADHAGFSIDYFNRMFLSHTGFTLMEYVRFVRLHKAAMKLRMTSDSILDIALTCGYESHETFCRAFKKQYDKTPSEYRESMRGVEMVYGDHELHATVAARLMHEFPQFKMASMDDAIDCLLSWDAIRYGYAAICCRINGGVALYDGNSLEDGFLWFEEWPDRSVPYECSIFSDDYTKIAEYCKLLPPDRFGICINTLDDSETVKQKLKEQGVVLQGISVIPQRVYRGAPYEITPPAGITMQKIGAAQLDSLVEYLQKIGAEQPQIDYYKRVVTAQENGGEVANAAFIFGIFFNGRMIGKSQGGLQRVHGFVLNNCIYTTIFEEYESEELYRYAFRYVTSAALEAGALPFDDLQYGVEPKEDKSGIFDAAIFGYETVNQYCRLIR